MAIDLNAIRSRLNKLQSTTKKSEELWKPEPGKHQIRLVPYKFTPDNPFIELYFHYDILKKTYLSPSSFGRPDPIVEFADKLKRMGGKEEWKTAKKMEPKLRTFALVVVRGHEAEGVKFWGFGKTVYQDLLGYLSDPDYGDITDPKTGRDLTIEVISAEDSGASYPTTNVRVKPKECLLSDDAETMAKFLDNQKQITEIYQELTYDELCEVMTKWLTPDAEADDEDISVATTTLAPEAKTTVTETKAPVVEVKPTVKVDEMAAAKKVDAVSTAFDKLFNS